LRVGSTPRLLDRARQNDWLERRGQLVEVLRCAAAHGVFVDAMIVMHDFVTRLDDIRSTNVWMALPNLV
jgi:hypothetical protein